MAGSLRIGTSGWHYKHWLGPFYPEKFPASKMLEFYSRHFDTVELNNTFYRLPSDSALAAWHTSAPSGFCFSAKGSRFLTHMKKLTDTGTGIERFFEQIDQLKPKLGPIVFQLPPFWPVHEDRLAAFLRALPRRHRYAFEFRNPTWHTDAIYKLLRKHNAAFCVFEIAGFETGYPVTADFTYVRLHGPEGAYQGSYSKAKLQKWAERIACWREELKSVYIYFDNDQAGYAAKDALALRSMLQ